MIVLVVRIALTALAVCFLGWLGYVMYLGLRTFFENKTDGKKVEVGSDHRKRRGGTWPNS